MDNNHIEPFLKFVFVCENNIGKVEKHGKNVTFSTLPTSFSKTKANFQKKLNTIVVHLISFLSRPRSGKLVKNCRTSLIWRETCRCFQEKPKTKQWQTSQWDMERSPSSAQMNRTHWTCDNVPNVLMGGYIDRLCNTSVNKVANSREQESNAGPHNLYVTAPEFHQNIGIPKPFWITSYSIFNAPFCQIIVKNINYTISK